MFLIFISVRAHGHLFQMVALGLVGFFAGVFFYGRESKRWLVALYGFFAVVIIYGAIVDLNTIFLLHSSFPYRWFVLCICQDFLLTCCLEQRLPDFCSVCIKPVLRRIERMVKKYRLFDKNEV